MGCLVGGDLSKPAASPTGQSSFPEVVLAELLEGTGVESVLQVLESEREVEDSRV
jgi:hypothetical protein